jgi:hypothetical protein
MPHGSRVVVLVPSIDLGNYRFLPPAAGPAAIPSVLGRGRRQCSIVLRRLVEPASDAGLGNDPPA